MKELVLSKRTSKFVAIVFKFFEFSLHLGSRQKLWQSSPSYVIYMLLCFELSVLSFLFLFYCGYRIRCPGSLMSLYCPTLLATPVDLCIVFQCKLNISCIMSCGNKLIVTCISVDRLLLPYNILQALQGGKNYNRCIMETLETDEI